MPHPPSRSSGTASRSSSLSDSKYPGLSGRRLGRAVRVGLSLAAVLTMIGAPRVAQALSCDTNVVVRPTDGDVVPTNTLLWGRVIEGTNHTLTLIGPEGAVPLMQVELPGAPFNTSVAVPTSELLPNTEYRLEYSYDDGERPFTAPTRFSTTDGPAEGRPPLPSIVSRTPLGGPGWTGGMNRWVELQFAPYEGIVVGTIDLPLSDASSVFDFFVDGTGPRSEDSVTMDWISDDPVLPVGRGDCVHWPSGPEDARQVRFGVFDLAGNFSGWVENETAVQLPTIEEAELISAQREAARRAEAAQQTQAAQQAQAALREEAAERYATQGSRRRDHNCSFTAPVSAQYGAGLATCVVLGLGALRRRLRRRAPSGFRGGDRNE